MLLHNFKKMSVLTCLLYFISMALNFAPMMSKITITRGMDVTRHPWWVSFVLSLLLLIMIIYTEFLSYKKLRYLVFSLIISLLLGILFFLEWLFISYNNNPAFVSFLSVGYLFLYLLYGPFYGLSCLFDAGIFASGSMSVQCVYIMPYIGLITCVMIANTVYVFVLLMINRILTKKQRRENDEKV